MIDTVLYFLFVPVKSIEKLIPQKHDILSVVYRIYFCYSRVSIVCFMEHVLTLGRKSVENELTYHCT